VEIQASNHFGQFEIARPGSDSAAFACRMVFYVGQFWVYIWVAHPKGINDPFLMLVILFESLISVGILLYVLNRRTAHDTKREAAFVTT